MKKLFLSSLAVFIVFLSQAQIKKGTTFIGGNIGYLHQTTSSDDSVYGYTPKNNNFNFTPSIGWAIKDNLVFGIDLGYGYAKNVDQQASATQYSKQNSFRAGVYLRKYKPLGSGFSLFGQVNLDYNYSKTKNYYNVTNFQDQSGRGAGLVFYPGVAYLINRHWQIEAGLGNFASINYTHSKTTNLNQPNPDVHSTSNSFSANTTLGKYFQFQAGLLYIM